MAYPIYTRKELVMRHTSEEDSKLAILVNAGDESASRQLYDKHYRWVYNKVVRVLGNHEDAQAVSQDIFVKAEQQIESWNPNQDNFEAWLNVVAKSTIIDAIRKKERIRESLLSAENESDVPLSESEDSKPTPDKQLETQDAKEILNQALQQVTRPHHRVAWILRHIEGHSLAEISQVFQREEEEVKIWSFRCTEELRQILVRKGITRRY